MTLSYKIKIKSKVNYYHTLELNLTMLEIDNKDSILLKLK